MKEATKRNEHGSGQLADRESADESTDRALVTFATDTDPRRNGLHVCQITKSDTIGFDERFWLDIYS